MVYDLSKSSVEQEPEYVEPYPSELNELRVVAAKIQKKYGFQQITESLKEQFVREVTDEFGQAGFLVQVTWSLDVSGGNDTNLFHIPSISLVGRTSREVATDFDRTAREIQSGELDGKVGVVREDGTLHEDKRKKEI